MTTRIALISISAAALAAAAEESRPGRASAEWLAASHSARPGQPLQTAIRIIHDDGWHSYWLNPGEAGLPTTIEWKLPPGWKHGGIRFPVPARFLSGELAGFGYEGTLLLPVTLVPPADFSGKARLRAEVSWLACGEAGCVPGNAGLVLEITAGDGSASPHSAEILAAIDQIPCPAGDALRLVVAEEGNSLTLTLHAGNPPPLDLAMCSVFPKTPELIDPAAVIRFTKKSEAWTATVPKSEYAESPVKALELVLADGKNLPLEVKWTAP